MDGYSVQEAASVLGVAEGRVWELLARGVLVGTPEGDSMRVFLKAQAGPIATAGAHDESPRTNGNGGSRGQGGEASAFRELLTEFRNLTERYGQALLALGEARGEVAGLRSRVDLLEARLDLRLPPPFEAGPLTWESATSEDVIQEPPHAATAPSAPPRQPVRAKRPRKERSPREAVAGFADALARAQDPNPAELGEADDRELPPEPIAGVEEVSAEEVAAEVAPAREAAEAEAPTYSAAVVEPDWFADGDFAWLDAAEMEAQGRAEPTATVKAAPAPEPEPEPQPEPEIAIEAAPGHEPQGLLESEPVAEPEPEIVPEPQPEFEAEADFEPWRPPEPPVQEVSRGPEPSPAPEPPTMSAATAVEDAEEEVMWLGEDREPGPVARDEPRDEPLAQADPWTVVDTVSPAEEVVRPPLAMTEDELARLALDEGWDEAEVAAIRAMITPLPSPRVELPGAADLHEAMAALEAVPVQSDPAFDPSRQWVKPAGGGEETTAYDDWAFEAEPPPPPIRATSPPAPLDVTSALRRAVSDPGWLRRRQGPAAAAYRRLRRLFPG